MYAVTVSFTIVPQMIDSFLPLMRQNATSSLRAEQGCHRFDVCTDPALPDVVFLYEVYKDRSAFEAHMQTPHFNSFETAVADMVKEKTVRCYSTVFP